MHAGAETLAFTFTLGKPAGAGPFPAAIILHDCSGLGCDRAASAAGRLSRARRRDGRSPATRRLQTAGALLILIGELDDGRRLAEATASAGYPVAIKVYPGAHHSFDSAAPVRYVAERINDNAPTGRGATTGGNAEAWADAIQQVVGSRPARQVTLHHAHVAAGAIRTLAAIEQPEAHQRRQHRPRR